MLIFVVKSIPVRCVIEVKNADKSCSERGEINQPVTETFAIVPTNSLFKDVVRTVLLKLGYSIHEASTAKGKDSLLHSWTHESGKTFHTLLPVKNQNFCINLK